MSLSRLLGANRRYIEEVIPHIRSLMVDSADDLIARSRTVVVGLRTSELTAALHRCITDDHMVLDLVNLPDKEKLRGRYAGVCW